MIEVVLTKENFEEEVLKYDGQVFVDFYEPGDERWITARDVAESFADAYEGLANIKVGKVNIQEYPELAKKYDVKYAPTVLLFTKNDIARYETDLRITLTDNTFEDYIKKSEVPVLVDFYASWCGPCQMISPVLMEIAREYKKEIRVAKADVDECREIASKYGIASIPTLILFKNGEPVNMSVGVVPKDAIVKMFR